MLIISSLYADSLLSVCNRVYALYVQLKDRLSSENDFDLIYTFNSTKKMNQTRKTFYAFIVKYCIVTVLYRFGRVAWRIQNFFEANCISNHRNGKWSTVSLFCFSKSWNRIKMNANLNTVVLFSLLVISATNAIPQHGGQSIYHDSGAAVSGQSQMPSQILTKCLCVPYYRCDPGHWENTEHDHCTRFMYVCCYGSEAVEYAMNHE